MKLKFDKHSLGMEADGVLGLECSANVTPCFIEKENGLSESCSSGLISSIVNGVAPPEHEDEVNYISKYLIQYVPTKKKVDTGKRATGARVLTSDECARKRRKKEKGAGRKGSSKSRMRAKEERKRREC